MILDKFKHTKNVEVKILKKTTSTDTVRKNIS